MTAAWSAAAATLILLLSYGLGELVISQGQKSGEQRAALRTAESLTREREFTQRFNGETERQAQQLAAGQQAERQQQAQAQSTASPPTNTNGARTAATRDGAALPTLPQSSGSNRAQTTEEAPAIVGEKEVVLRADGFWVNVYVNGELRAENQMATFRLTLPYGTHQLRFTNPRAEPMDMQVRVNEREPPALSPIRLSPLPATLVVRNAPDGSLVEVAERRVLINERTRNEPIRIPIERGSFSATHSVRITLGEQVFEQSLEFTTGETQTLAVSFAPL